MAILLILYKECQADNSVKVRRRGTMGAKEIKVFRSTDVDSSIT